MTKEKLPMPLRNWLENRYCFVTCLVALLSTFGPSYASDFIPVCDTDRAIAVSDDGTTVVCDSRREASIWTEAEGVVALGFLQNDSRSRASGVSADGGTVVGYSGDWPNDVEAFRWTVDGGMTGLGKTNGGFGTFAQAASANGEFVVGRTSTDNFRAWYWTESDGVVDITDERSFAYDVSTDGSVIVGSVSDLAAGVSDAFRWTLDGGLEKAGFLDHNGIARTVSADGGTVVGSAFSAEGVSQPFLWTETNHRLLGRLATEQFLDSSPLSTTPSGVSNNGEIVVGNGFTDELVSESFIWHETTGMLDLVSVLVDEYGLGDSLEGWKLDQAWDISPDGRFIVGRGTNPQGDSQGWLARLDYAVPEPASSTSLLVGLLVLLQWRPKFRSQA